MAVDSVLGAILAGIQGQRDETEEKKRLRRKSAARMQALARRLKTGRGRGITLDLLATMSPQLQETMLGLPPLTAMNFQREDESPLAGFGLSRLGGGR